LLAGLSLFGVAACEDGPKDNFAPAPKGAGWNDPHTRGVASTAMQPYMVSNGGTNANDICTPDQVKAARSKYFSAPILPPGLAAGLDIAGGAHGDGASGYDPLQQFHYDPTQESWTGATVEMAEKILCQGYADSIYYGVTNTLGWGDQQEVSVMYNSSNRQITDILLQTGYEGSVDATSSDGKKQYSIKLNNAPIQVTQNGQTTSLIIKWSDAVLLNRFANDLYDALRHQFIPDFPADADCVAAGHCIVGNNLGQGGYFWFTPINLAFFVNTTVGTDIVNSTPTLIDLGKLKLLGFSTASVLMKLDAGGEGPVAVTTNVYSTGKDCRYRLGMTYADFRGNCAEPFSDPMKNKVEENKLFGSIGHDAESYSFDIQGIDPNFTATLPDNKIVGDKDRPVDADIAYELNVDQEALGKVANDYVNNDTTKAQDWHGVGLVTLEWANIVQKYLRANYGVNSDLGDPACVAHPSRSATPGKICSGIEGIVTTAPTTSIPAGSNMHVNALGATAILDPNSQFGAIAVGLKPGTWYSYFCTDGAGISGNPVTGESLSGYQNCYGTSALYNGYYIDTMQYMVTQAFGNTPVPNELTSRRFYFKMWIFALIKYFQVADNATATLAQVDAATIDGDNLFFDSAGGGFDFAEYVDRHSVNSNGGQPPTDVSMAVNLQTSVMNNFNFSRHNYRGEKALYTVLTENPMDKPGAEKVLLTNLVGSSVLKSTYGTYDCAINTDPMMCNGMLAPADASGKLLLDDNGQPLLTAYKGAFGQTFLHLPALGEPPTLSTMTVNAPGFELLASAMVAVPLWGDPFDPSTAAQAPAGHNSMSVLLPYYPRGAGVGFPVTVDGSRDKFYNTLNVDFSGETITASLDFEVAQGTGPQAIIPRAIETTDFLGLVFLCAEPNATTGRPDVLAVRMYTNSQDILDWFTEHPAGMNDCDVVYKYSIYGNYPDYITSRANGVRLGINPGYGGGVVTDVTVFDPNVVAALGE
jgi:hypothetical protein